MRTIRLAVVGVAALATAGCSTVAMPFDTTPVASTATPYYMARWGSQSFPSSPELIDRSRLAMEDVGVHTIVQRQENNRTLLEGKTATGWRAVVAIRPDGATSLVAARFGPLGDEPLSRAFLDRMVARAGTIAPAETKAEATVTQAPRRPAPNRASTPPGSITQSQLEGGYRDSVSP